MKKLYLFTWIALAAAVLVSVFTATLDAAAAFVYSLIALALFYSLALWSVLANSHGVESAWSPESARSYEPQGVK